MYAIREIKKKFMQIHFQKKIPVHKKINK